VLAFLAHGRWVKTEEMIVDGIRRITPDDIAYAQSFGYSIKLLAIISRRFDSNDLFVCVQPTLVPKRNALANVHEVYNGICVSGDVVGTTVYIGRGAGQDATASAVISDIADAVTLLAGERMPLLPDDAAAIHCGTRVGIAPLKSIVSRYYIRLAVKDQPGVLAQVATIMATNHVSIASVLQRESREARAASLILTTHETTELAIQQTVLALKSCPSVLAEPALLRIADFGS
jgi:homoserine dehydrogenase